MPGKLKTTPITTENFESLSAPASADFSYYEARGIQPSHLPNPQGPNITDPKFIYTEGNEPTPIDEKISKLPLPILPADNTLKTSEHHHAHPRSHPLLQKAGGIVVRTVRLQTVEGDGGSAKRNWWGIIPHKYGTHQRYHYFYQGPPLPETEKNQFEYAVWAASGYMPEQALDVTGRKPRIVNLTPEKIKILQGDIVNQSAGLLQDFLKDYVFKQDLSHVNERQIDEFVSTQDWDRKRYLGRWLLAQASELATDDMRETYRMAHKRGLIVPWVSSKVSNVVQVNFLTKKREQGIIEQYQHRLLAS